MIFWFLKTVSKNAWLESIPTTETKQEVDEVLMSISSVVDRASLQWQNNCKNTLWKSLKYIDQNIGWHPLDWDIALRLLRLCSDFTTDDMQELVAKILAWEYNKPWTFSLKTLDVVRNLTKQDIELFKKFCWYVFNWKCYLINPYTSSSPYWNILDSQWIWYNQLNYLQDLWLVSNNDSAISKWDKNDKETENGFTVSIQNKNFSFKKKGYIEIWDVSALTTAWVELLSVTWFFENEELVKLVEQYFYNLFKWNK